jgi:parallel beta-helix repeat protein
MATSRKAIEFFSIAAIVAILAFLSLSATASAAVINVPSDYTTIQQAINNVTPANRTIEVNATAYNAQGIPETVDVNESDIIIRSINGRAVVSAGGASDHVVNITGQTNVTLQGFEIRDAHGTTKDVAGIYMHNVTECTISNNNVTNITATNWHAYGIYLGYSSDNRFSSSTSVSNITGEYAYGIWLENSSDNRFNPSTSVSHITAATQDAYGILLYPFSNNNTFNSSTSVSYISAVNVAYGISLVGASTNTFSPNISVSHVNASSYACGIWLWDSSDNRFRLSTSISTITATNNDAYGIYLFFSSNNNSFTNFTITEITSGSGTTSYGVSLYKSSGNVFTGGSISSTGEPRIDYAVWMENCTHNTINESDIRNNEHGFWLDQSDYSTIERNMIIDNIGPATGVHVSEQSDWNKINENCFYCNVLQAFDDGAHNNWDRNFWSPPPGETGDYTIPGGAESRDRTPLAYCPMCTVQVPTLTPTGMLALLSLLSAFAAVAIVRKRR